jgi:site-specific recombinase XerD
MDPASFIAITYLSGFHNANTRQAYATDIRLWFEWCGHHGLPPLQAKRAHLQAFAIHLTEHRRNKPASVSRRIGTLKGFYETAVLDGHLEYSPAHHLKLPKIHPDGANRPWLNRWELGALMRSARVSTKPADWALITLMGTLGMRVTAACNVQISDITTDPVGYRLLHTIGKGDKPSVKVLPIPTWQAIDRAAGDRDSGALLQRRDGSQMTRRSADRVVQRLAAHAGIRKKISPHALRRSFATLLLQAGVDARIVQDGLDHTQMRTTMIYDRLGVEPHAAASNTMAALLASAS